MTSLPLGLQSALHARLAQGLLADKRELDLPHEMRRLDRFDAIILDGIGYIQQDREEMEALSTLLEGWPETLD